MQRVEKPATKGACKNLYQQTLKQWAKLGVPKEKSTRKNVCFLNARARSMGTAGAHDALLHIKGHLDLETCDGKVAPPESVHVLFAAQIFPTCVTYIALARQL
jgi:hypothetical protein